MGKQMHETRNSVCAGGVVVQEHTKKVLVVNQRGLAWSLPKGHIDPEEMALEAAIREIEEESGLEELKVIKYLGSYQRYKIALDDGDEKSEFKTIHMYLFTTNQTQLHPKDKDNPEARWVEPDRVEELLTHRKDKEFYRSVRREISVV